MTHVTVGSATVVTFFKDNLHKLEREYEQIAENEDYGVVIYLSSINGSPVVTVFADGDQRSEITTSVDCLENIVKATYETYLSPRAIDVLAVDGNSDDEEFETNEMTFHEMEIDDRESEIDEAVDIFLSNVLQVYGSDGSVIVDEIHDDVKEHFLEYLYRKHKLEIYRPMFLEDESGEEFFEEYPYECMEFEDKDNPIYK